MSRRWCIILAFLLWQQPLNSLAQQGDTTTHKSATTKHTDSLKAATDTAINTMRLLISNKVTQFKADQKDKIKTVLTAPRTGKIIDSQSLKFDLAKPYKNLFKTRPLFRMAGGYMAYNFNFRSNVDTPYVERNIAQHNITGQFNFTAGALLPIQVNYWVRQSNSTLFRDITDVQVSFNGNDFRNRLQTAIWERLLALSTRTTDSLTEKLYNLKSLQLDEITDLLDNSFSRQGIVEAHDILRVPRITWDPNLTDSVNSKREDSIKKVATFLLALYEKTKSRYDSLRHEVDSLKHLHEEGLQKIDKLRGLVKGGWKDYFSMRDLENQLTENGISDANIPRKYRWMLGLRNLSLGRSTANYSELTAKNVSVNGINFEYNSWYYFALMAGIVNYRFRDFTMRGADRKPQTMMLVRAGLGSLERNYFILSAYRGQKQLFGGNASHTPLVTVSGLSAESRWRLNRTSWISVELAKSMAPDYRNNPPQGSAKLDWSDRSSQAMAFRLYSYLPSTNTRLEAFYKHTGANFQSFSSFYTNADMKSWYIKAEQNLFKRKLRISAALRSNEFYNPFIVQNYKSNTVFKSVSASFRARKWPAVTVAYQPMSQLTSMEDRIVENRFQTLNATLYHLYKVKTVKTASTVMFNKFYNNSSDTGFIYYNATNFYWTQHFFFKSFTTHIGASHTKNSGYMLTVLDGGIQPYLKDRGSIGIGVRVNNFNNEVIKVGGYLNLNIRVNKRDMLYVNYEHGYLPGFSQNLVRNEMAGVQFVKTF